MKTKYRGLFFLMNIGFLKDVSISNGKNSLKNNNELSISFTIHFSPTRDAFE